MTITRWASGGVSGVRMPVNGTTLCIDVGGAGLVPDGRVMAWGRFRPNRLRPLELASDHWRVG